LTKKTILTPSRLYPEIIDKKALAPDGMRTLFGSKPANAVLAALLFVGLAIASPRSVLAGGTGVLVRSQPYTDQLIIKYRDTGMVKAATAGNSVAKETIMQRLSTMTALAGVKIAHARFMSGNGHVIKLPKAVTITEARAVAQKLGTISNVEYVEPDVRMFPMQVPNDPYYSRQWHYKSPAAPDFVAGGVNLPGAWDITTGSADIVVAVIDTGILPNHPEISGRTVGGYNFITDPLTANNTVGRSPDPTDPGDWITADESSNINSPFYKCDVTDSSWHGTHVAGTIGASSHNGTGVAGINWVSKILPLRVLGKCGGTTSDIVDAMRWAVGLHVPEVPDNPYPAKVINMSLGGTSTCGTVFQSAVDDVIAAGTTIVVAAGNENTDVATSIPANCSGVISVAAINRAGGRAYYSNYGSGVKIAAPGGEVKWSGADGVLSTSNNGTTTATSNAYWYYSGTSQATPHVAGIVSLMLSRSPTLTPSKVLGILQSSARGFPIHTGSAGGDCSTSLCGAGIIDATAAILATPAPFSISTTGITNIEATTATSGGSVTLADGGLPITAKGVCWGTSTDPSTSSATCTNDGSGSGAFASSLTGLMANTIYHVRAYAVDSAGTTYGADQSFTTAAQVLPILTTTDVHAISTTSATSGGTVTSNGGAVVTFRGVCWGTSANPSTSSATCTNDGSGSGAFASSLTGLMANTTYHVRAYAGNSAGTAYGLDQNFTTSSATPATVTTDSVTAITTVSATGGGNVTLGGGAAITAKGICWSTLANPTTSDNCSVNDTGTGPFNSAITGLSGQTTYHVRGYAINSNGTSYGSDISFTTVAASTTPTVITAMPVKSITTTTASSGGKISSNGGERVTARGVCWSTVVNPAIGGNCTSDGTGSGRFISSITGLATNTRYYVRAFASNANGTSYGSNVTFKTGKRPVRFILYPPR